MFLGKGVLKICSKFTGEHPCRSAISIKLFLWTAVSGISIYIWYINYFTFIFPSDLTLATILEDIYFGVLQNFYYMSESIWEDVLDAKLFSLNNSLTIWSTSGSTMYRTAWESTPSCLYLSEQAWSKHIFENIISGDLGCLIDFKKHKNFDLNDPFFQTLLPFHFAMSFWYHCNYCIFELSD